MTHPLFDKHRATLEGALAAIQNRGFWSAYPEQPSPKVYGETAADTGKAAALAHMGQRFELGQPEASGWSASERSPYGVPLGVQYPVSKPQALIDAALAAMPAWQGLGPEGRTGVLLEALARINKASFEIAHAVMLTTGQGWMMAFQAGGPHAQDRALEAVAYAWREMSFVPATARWEKPQGKNPPIVMEKRFEIVGRGVALVIGCGTFPTWNTYPGLFAALATGNPVIVKPHPNAILPAAISVRIIREVLKENGIAPDLVTLAVTDDPKVTQALATSPAVKSIDFTGSNAFGRWLIDNARQAQVYAELAGVNNVVIESTDSYKAMLKNLAFTLSLYSGQMCTTTQDIFVPAGGIETDEGHKSFDQLAADLGIAVDKLPCRPGGGDRSARCDPVSRHAQAHRRGAGTGRSRAGVAQDRSPGLSGGDRAFAGAAESRHEQGVGVPAGALRPDQLYRQGSRLAGCRGVVRAGRARPRRADCRTVFDEAGGD